MRPFVIIPTYNEYENVKLLIPELLALPNRVHIIIVDDNSPDGTGQFVDALASREERLHVIHRDGKLGLGTAYVAGFQAALVAGADRIMTMDADYSHHPSYVLSLLEASQTADLVIGSRYVDSGEVVDSPYHRRVLSRGANAFARVILGLKAHDCTAGFRCYRRRVLESIDLDTFFSDGYSFLIELLCIIERRGFSVSEVPIRFMDRQHGTSKISRKEILKAMYTLWRLRFGSSV